MGKIMIENIERRIETIMAEHDDELEAFVMDGSIEHFQCKALIDYLRARRMALKIAAGRN